MKKTCACKRHASFRTVSWNLAGLAEDSLEPFLACTSMTMRWDVLLLQETFRKLEGLETESCQIFTPENILGRAHGGWRCLAIIAKNRISEECVLPESGVRWVSMEMQFANRVLISAHLPTIKAPLEDFNVLFARNRTINPEVPGSRSDPRHRREHKSFSVSKTNGIWDQARCPQSSRRRRKKEHLLSLSF